MRKAAEKTIADRKTSTRQGGGARKRPITSKGGQHRDSKASPKPRPRTKTAKSTGRRPPKLAPASKRRADLTNAALRAWFPRGSQPKLRFGLGVTLAVADRQGDESQMRYARVEQFSDKPGQRPRRVFLAAADPAVVARILTGLAHADRIRLARAVLTGANTHHLLSKAVQLKTGPLYHHLRELQRAGLFTSGPRNRYELTELGRIVLLISTVLGTMGAKRRSPWCTIQLGPTRRRRERKKP